MKRVSKYPGDEQNWWSLLCCGTEWPVTRQLEIWAGLWLLLVVLSIIAVNETSDICNQCSDMIAIPNASRTSANNRTLQETCIDIVIDLWHHNATECNRDGQVLLSRAFTTLGWARGFAIGYALLSILFISITPIPIHKQRPLQIFIKIPLVVALLIFSSAFEVSMFESHAHGVLIGIGSVIGILFTIPGPPPGLPKYCCAACFRHDKILYDFGSFSIRLRTVWWFLWSFMVLNCLLFVGFWLDSIAQFEKEGRDIEKAPYLRSDWYWCEYLFFWTMYLLVGYAIGAEETEEFNLEEIESLTKQGDGLVTADLNHRRKRTDFNL